MKDLIITLIIWCMVTIWGCAAISTKTNDSDFGQYPSEYKSLIIASLDVNVKSQADVHYLMGVPQKAFRQKHLSRNTSVTWKGYLVDFYIYQRDKYDGITGFDQKYVALIRDGKVYEIDSEVSAKTCYISEGNQAIDQRLYGWHQPPTPRWNFGD